jgi:hypothetical protein
VSATPAADDHYAFDPAASAYGEMQSLQVQYSQQAHYAQGPAVSDALAVGAGSASVCSVQQQPVLTHAEQAAEVTEALKAAQQHPGPLARQRMVKDLKQQLYKVRSVKLLLVASAQNAGCCSSLCALLRHTCQTP